MSTDTSQVLFRAEYQHELDTWLRRRFAYLCLTYGVLAAFGLISSTWELATFWRSIPAASVLILTLLTSGKGAASLAIVAFFYLRRERRRTRDDVLRAASSMILALGTVSLLSRFGTEWMGLDYKVGVIFSVFFWHITACLFLPWTPRDSLRPIVPLLAVWVAYTLFLGDGDVVGRLLSVMFSPGILIPGLVICGWRLKRHSRRFRSTMLGKHFRNLRQEFTRARTIHESLFPQTYDDGFIRIEYTYRPMRELGGDFIHLSVSPQGIAHMTLLDVTGHGLAAALTVNRIYGELERIRGESPNSTPGEVMRLLNRYIGLTMARHNIYATAVAFLFDPYVGEVRWASAGHPPAFCRGANNVVRELGSTGLMLGAVGDEDFEIQEETMELAPGDVIVAFTDGTFEARGHDGSRLGLTRLRRLMEGPQPAQGWPRSISAAVDRHRVGRAEDDVLVASMTLMAQRPQATTQPAIPCAIHTTTT